MSQVFEFTSYSSYLRSLTGENTKIYSVATLAKFAGVQRPYLSNVLAGRSHLNTEQGFRLGEELGFDEQAQNYFSLLIEHERATDLKFKSFLLGKIKRQQATALKLESQLARPTSAIQAAMTAEYFSAWEYCALHILSSIPNFQKPEAMAQALRLPLSYTIKNLDRLVSWGLVQNKNGAYSWASGNIHVPSDSPSLTFHHRNWRERSVEDSRHRAGETIHFTSVYSMSASDYEKFHRKILEFLKEYNSVAAKSKEEKLISFNLDFFDVV